MKTKFTLVALISAFSLYAQEPAEDTGKLRSGKIGMDIRIGWNQASTGGILHLTQWLAFNPYVLYKNAEKTDNYATSPAYGSAVYSYTDKESFFGLGGFLPIYLARIENLHVRLMPGFSYMGGKISRSQSSSGVTYYDQTSNTTVLTYKFFIGLQYAFNRHLHVFGETGYNYSEYKSGFFNSKSGNFYSGNIGLIFYFN